MPCSPQLPEGDVLIEAQAVVALLLGHVAPLLPARNKSGWHHSVTTVTSGPPVCFLPPWATLLKDREAPRAPQWTGRHREPLGVVLDEFPTWIHLQSSCPGTKQEMPQEKPHSASALPGKALK